jgi:hypothetical protein
VRLAALLAVVGLAACDDGSSGGYSYFLVPVTIDQQSVDQELLGLIAFCGAEAKTPQGNTGADLRCVRGRIPYQLGNFEYTTTQTSGSITFSVVLQGINHNPLASGESSPVGVVPGKTVEVPAIVVKAIPGAPRMPPDVPNP